MAKKRKIKRKAHTPKKRAGLGKGKVLTILAVASFAILLLFAGDLRSAIFNSITQVFGAKQSGGGGGYDTAGGCAQKSIRPCYDKLTSSGVNILGKNGENTYTSCISNAAPNKVGEIIQKTSVCGQEKVEYCHDGTSSNFIRKFSGKCATEPPPSPPPSPEPTSTPGPVTQNPFKITFPNGGEQLPYGSQQVIEWEGGDTVNTWPIFLSIVDRDRNVSIREMVIETPNDGQENWVVDLPLGNYYVYYGQGCRNAACTSLSQWDQSDAKFSVVAGSPVEKINSIYPLNQSLVVLSPSGGEVFPVDSTQTLKWSGQKDTSTIDLYLVDDKQSYVTIARNSTNDGTEPWLVPAFVPPGQYKLYAACSNCGTVPTGYTGGLYNYSFYPFTIK